MSLIFSLLSISLFAYLPAHIFSNVLPLLTIAYLLINLSIYQSKYFSMSLLFSHEGRAISISRSLTDLNLSYNGIGDLGAEAIASALILNERYERTP